MDFPATLAAEANGKHKVIRVTEFPGGPAGCGRITGWRRCIGTLSVAGDLRSRRERCTSRGRDECLRVFDQE